MPQFLGELEYLIDPKYHHSSQFSFLKNLFIIEQLPHRNNLRTSSGGSNVSEAI